MYCEKLAAVDLNGNNGNGCGGRIEMVVVMWIWQSGTTNKISAVWELWMQNQWLTEYGNIGSGTNK